MMMVHGQDFYKTGECVEKVTCYDYHKEDGHVEDDDHYDGDAWLGDQ